MPTAFMVVGLGFGDEGKGSIVDYLVRRYEARLVVRFNGGAQAAHNVVTPDGRHHTFAQFGSGTFVPGVRTHLGPRVLVNPFALMREADHLREVGVPDALARLTVDPLALVTTPYHTIANRVREQRRSARHGSCGMGIGETAAFAERFPQSALRMRDLGNPAVTIGKLRALRGDLQGLFDGLVVDSEEELTDKFLGAAARIKLQELPREIGNVVFEGAQGVLLDERYGFPPHQTHSNCTLSNALDLTARLPAHSVRKIGVIRTYATRHGEGPFPTEFRRETDGRSAAPPGWEEKHNATHEWQGGFRVGSFDVPLTRYAIDATGVDEIALTHVDRAPFSVCIRYKFGEPVERLRFNLLATHVDQTRLARTLSLAQPVLDSLHAGADWDLERMLGLPIRILSRGPTYLNKMERDHP